MYPGRIRVNKYRKIPYLALLQRWRPYEWQLLVCQTEECQPNLPLPPLRHFLLADCTVMSVIGSVDHQVSTRTEKTVDVKDSECGGKTLSNNSYIQKFDGTIIFKLVFAFKRESVFKMSIVLHCMGQHRICLNILFISY